MNEQRDEVSALLRQWTAAETSGDTAALRCYLADDFTGIGPLGFALSRQDWLARHATGALNYETFRLEDMQIRGYGDAAVVTARQQTTGAYLGQELPGALRTTLVLAKTSGAWRIVGIHMSFIAGTPGAPPIPGPPPGSQR